MHVQVDMEDSETAAAGLNDLKDVLVNTRISKNFM